jgi:hypothetical protein
MISPYCGSGSVNPQHSLWFGMTWRSYAAHCLLSQAVSLHASLEPKLLDLDKGHWQDVADGDALLRWVVLPETGLLVDRFIARKNDCPGAGHLPGLPSLHRAVHDRLVDRRYHLSPAKHAHLFSERPRTVRIASFAGRRWTAIHYHHRERQKFPWCSAHSIML